MFVKILTLAVVIGFASSPEKIRQRWFRKGRRAFGEVPRVGMMSEKSSCRSQLGRMLRMFLEIRTKRFPSVSDLAEACEVRRSTICRDAEVLAIAIRTAHTGLAIG